MTSWSGCFRRCANTLGNAKHKLRANTDEVIERGAYGSPTIYINGDDMYFGNDRLPLVERKLDLLARQPGPV